MSKKSFINDVTNEYNPAQAFISTPPLKDKEAIEAELKEVRAKKENASKPRLEDRLNLLISKQLHNDLSDLSRFDGKSINSIINKVLTEYTESRQADIEKIRSL